jgi:Flp pilus assembly pilin Flp
MTFVEILAAQRDARRVADAAVASQGAEPWWGGSPGAASNLDVALTDADRPGAETAEEVGSTDAGRRIHPRIIGQGMVEYAVVVVLIAIVVIVLLGTVGHQAQDVFSNLSRGLST